MANRALAVRYLPANVTTPPGTLVAAPQVTNLDLGDVVLLAVHLRIPSGHTGLTGWRIDYSSSTIVPFTNPSQYIVADDERLDFDVDFEVGRTLQIVTYNLDLFPHTHYATAKVTDVDRTDYAPVQLLDVSPS